MSSSGGKGLWVSIVDEGKIVAVQLGKENLVYCEIQQSK
jgi:hypothetical protein